MGAEPPPRATPSSRARCAWKARWSRRERSSLGLRPAHCALTEAVWRAGSAGARFDEIGAGRGKVDKFKTTHDRHHDRHALVSQHLSPQP